MSIVVVPGLVALVTAGASAVTRRVPSEYPTIQAALDASSAGDEVLVAPGTYTHSETRVQEGGGISTSCAFLSDGVLLRSEGGPTVTWIDMQQAAGPAPVVVLARYQLSGQSTVEGFTITGAPPGGSGAYLAFGNWVTFRDCVFRDLDAGVYGGGGIAANGDLRLEGCEFVNCLANSGGAIYHSNGRIEMYDCAIRECGGIGVLLAGPPGGPVESSHIERCTFEGCWASSGGVAALSAQGQHGGSVVRDCRFIANVGASSVGAVGVSGFPPTPLLVEGCLFWNNSAPGGNGQGGGLSIAGPSIVRGNTFMGNMATNHGGALSYFSFSSGELSNNVFLANECETGAVYAEGIPLTTSCNVFWENAPGTYYQPGPTDRIVDPLLCDPMNGDFRLMVGSPCLPPGSMGCGLIGAFGEGCGVISLEPLTWGQTKAAYRLQERSGP